MDNLWVPIDPVELAFFIVVAVLGGLLFGVGLRRRHNSLSAFCAQVLAGLLLLSGGVKVAQILGATFEQQFWVTSAIVFGIGMLLFGFLIRDIIQSRRGSHN